MCLLVLLLLLGGFFFFFKRRNEDNKTQVQTKDSLSDTVSNHTARRPTEKTTDPSIREDFVNSDANTIDMGPVESEPAPLPTITPIDLPKSHKSKHGGYSKQQFDEFE